MFANRKRSDGLINDYCDGSDFSQHPLFIAHPNALQIMLYFDDVELCNPIGTKAKIHKMGTYRLCIYVVLNCIMYVLNCFMYINNCIIILFFIIIGFFYYTFGNLRPCYHSTYWAIQLLSVVKSSLLVKYGPEKVLESFIAKIKEIEQVCWLEIHKNISSNQIWYLHGCWATTQESYIVLVTCKHMSLLTSVWNYL